MHQTAALSAPSRDVVFAFFGCSWAHAAAHGFSFSEDRLALRLTRHNAVARLVVCNPYRSAAGRATARFRRGREPAFPTTPTAHLYEPLRLRRTDPVDPERSIARYERGVRRAADRHGLERPAVITTNPLVAGFGTFEWAGPVTYYAYDDWRASLPHRRWWPAYDEAFARIRTGGRRVVAVSERALERIAPTGPATIVPNGVEPAEWEDLSAPPDWFAAKAGPRLLYVGSLDSRVDVSQMRAAAESQPNGTLTMIGAMLEPGHFASLRDVPNLEIRAHVPRAEIVSLIGAADACLVPHIRNPLTEAMSPLKLYEYLAGGAPVAAVSLPPIERVAGRVALAPPGGDFAPAVREALALGRAPETERQAFLAANAWDRRFDDLLALALAG